MRALALDEGHEGKVFPLSPGSSPMGRHGACSLACSRARNAAEIYGRESVHGLAEHFSVDFALARVEGVGDDPIEIQRLNGVFRVHG